MGLDLSLLPIYNEIPEDPKDLGRERDRYHSFSVIALDRRHSLFEEIMSIEEKRGKPIPKNFSSFLCRDEEFEEHHYGRTREDGYGSPLNYVLVKDLLPLSSHQGVINNYQNKAIWEYLKALPDKIPIVLYWD